MVASVDSDPLEIVDAETVDERPHSLAYWVAPPVDPVAYSDVISLDFGHKGLPDVLAPYAFLGPRISPPFRPLYCIGRLELDDLSDWAENLRWAAEQRTTFGAAADGWNESPEHMSRISQIRIEHRWVSQERQQSRGQLYSSVGAAVDEYLPGETNGLDASGADSLVGELNDLPGRWYEEDSWYNADVSASSTG
jgi:hypothetical protein